MMFRTIRKQLREMKRSEKRHQAMLNAGYIIPTHLPQQASPPELLHDDHGAEDRRRERHAQRKGKRQDKRRGQW